MLLYEIQLFSTLPARGKVRHLFTQALHFVSVVTVMSHVVFLFSALHKLEVKYRGMSIAHLK